MPEADSTPITLRPSAPQHIMTPGRSPLIFNSMEKGKEDRPIREEEARYLVIQIVKQYPKLDAMLVEAQLRGRPWTEILKMLREKIASSE